MLNFLNNFALPAKIHLSSTIPFKPWPAISSTFWAWLFRAVSLAYWATALAMGWVELFSIMATSRTSSVFSILELTTSWTLKTPLVSVPVLSITTTLILVITSKKLEPLNKIPFLEAKPIPPKYPSGMDTTKAQGQLITKNTNER